MCRLVADSYFKKVCNTVWYILENILVYRRIGSIGWSTGARGRSYRGFAGARGSGYRGCAGARGRSYRGCAGARGRSYRGVQSWGDGGE